MAVPGEHREHEHPTPLVGGIAMFVGLVVGVMWLDSKHLALLPSLSLIFIVGVVDDRFKLPSWIRLLAQATAAYLLILFANTELQSLGYIVSDTESELGGWSQALTIFATIGVINAINMSDGLDGLLGTLSSLLVLTVLFLAPGFQQLSQILLCVLAGFLFWNLRVFRDRATVFMGDAGSTLLGVIIAYLLIQISQQPNQYIAPVTALWLLALPLMDAVAVLLIRPLRGQSPFSADRIHYHHLVRAKGLSVNSTLLVVLMVQGIFTFVGVLMHLLAISEHHQFYGFLFCFAVYFGYLMHFTKEQEGRISNS